MKVSKLAQIFYTGTLDHIFGDSGEKKNLAGLYGPVRSAENRENRENRNFCQGYATLGPYCRPMGGAGGRIFFVWTWNKQT